MINLRKFVYWIPLKFFNKCDYGFVIKIYDKKI